MEKDQELIFSPANFENRPRRSRKTAEVKIPMGEIFGSDRTNERDFTKILLAKKLKEGNLG